MYLAGTSNLYQSIAFSATKISYAINKLEKSVNRLLVDNPAKSRMCHSTVVNGICMVFNKLRSNPA